MREPPIRARARPAASALDEVLRLVGANRAYASLPSHDRDDAVQIARVEALLWHRREGAFRSRCGDALPPEQVAHRLARHAAARLHGHRARDARLVGEGTVAGAEDAPLDALPDREIGDPLERLLAAESGFGALRDVLMAPNPTPAVRNYIRCVLNDDGVATVAAESASRPNTVVKANQRIHARIVEHGAGVIPARRPRCSPPVTDIGALQREARALVEAAGPTVRAIARLLRHGELRRGDGRPDWESIAAALQQCGHAVVSSAGARAAWQDLLRSLPRDCCSHAVGRVEWGLRLRDVPTP